MRNSIAYLMIFRNHVRFFVRNQIAAFKRTESAIPWAASPGENMAYHLLKAKKA